MPEGEQIEAVALGNDWAAVCTDAKHVRVFSLEGQQKYILQQASQIVTMTGYENLLVIVYHSGVPLYDYQQMNCKIIDTNTFTTLYDSQCPVSVASDLTWVGFSEEGLLTTMDSNGII
jgi:chromosome transmission fidelity protein 4